MPVPVMLRPLLIPLSTVEDDGAKVRKSALLLLMQELFQYQYKWHAHLKISIVAYWRHEKIAKQ